MKLQLFLIFGFVFATKAQNMSINLMFIWDTPGVSTEARSIFNRLILPDIKSACPSTNYTIYNFKEIVLSVVPSADVFSASLNTLRTGNFLFVAMQSSVLTTSLVSLNVNVTYPHYPVMRTHIIASIDYNSLFNVLLQVAKHIIEESKTPSHLLHQNHRAAFILEPNIPVPPMSAMFTYFHMGAKLYRYRGESSVESILLDIRKHGFLNVFLILNPTDSYIVLNTAQSLSLLSFHIRWFVHHGRWYNYESFSFQITSNNITSIEYGRYRDTMALDLRTSHSVLLYDILVMWKEYFRVVACNSTAVANKLFYGFSGDFQMSSNGIITRKSYRFQVFQGLGVDRYHLGDVDNTGRFHVIHSPEIVRNDAYILKELRENQFIVLFMIDKPYVYFKEQNKSDLHRSLVNSLEGAYFNICKTLLDELKIYNVQYNILTEGGYGTLNPVTLKWSGLMGALTEGKTHLVGSPLVIDSKRSHAIDFSVKLDAFSNSILYKKVDEAYVEKMFQFLLPLDTRVWPVMLGILLFVAFVLFIMHKMIPIEESKNFTLYNSIFFSFAEVVQGTAGLRIVLPSAKILVTFFWVFTLFFMLSYVCNYCSLTVHDGLKVNVTSLQTLLQSEKFEFGTVANTSVETALRDSTFSYIQQIYKYMTESFTDGLMPNVSVAIKRVVQGNFALIYTNRMNEYLKDSECNLINTGLFYEQQTALGYPKGVDYQNIFNIQLQKMLDSGYINAVLKEYFTVKNPKDCKNTNFLSLLVPPEPWPVKLNALTLTDTLGIAMINIFGCLISLTLSLFEMVCRRIMHKRFDRRKLKQESKMLTLHQLQKKKEMMLKKKKEESKV